MGRLTEDMTRLCGEIQALRGSRQAFVEDLAIDVSEMCGDFADTRARMAKRSREARLASVNNLKQNVTDLKREISADLAGARRAWFSRGA